MFLPWQSQPVSTGLSSCQWQRRMRKNTGNSNTCTHCDRKTRLTEHTQTLVLSLLTSSALCPPPCWRGRPHHLAAAGLGTAASLPCPSTAPRSPLLGCLTGAAAGQGLRVCAYAQDFIVGALLIVIYRRAPVGCMRPTSPPHGRGTT